MLGGAVVSQHKTEVLWVNEGPPPEWLENLEWKVQNHHQISRYLGLPLGLNMSLNQAWEWIWPRIEETMGQWEGKEVDFPTRVVIINQVLMAKVNFYITVFPPTEKIMVQIERRLRHYLWHNGGHSRMAWVKWDICTMRKEDGGLGIRSLREQVKKYVVK
eukprot:c29832_g1_i1 orf=3-482(+)